MNSRISSPPNTTRRRLSSIGLCICRGFYRSRDLRCSDDMIDERSLGHLGGDANGPLALVLGCTFGLETFQPAAAIMQVAPRAEPTLSIRRERWDTSAYHH